MRPCRTFSVNSSISQIGETILNEKARAISMESMRISSRMYRMLDRNSFTLFSTADRGRARRTYPAIAAPRVSGSAT